MKTRVVQVGSFMWLRTTMNYQYANGGTLGNAISTLYKEGGREGAPRPFLCPMPFCPFFIFFVPTLSPRIPSLCDVKGMNANTNRDARAHCTLACP